MTRESIWTINSESQSLKILLLKHYDQWAQPPFSSLNKRHFHKQWRRTENTHIPVSWGRVVVVESLRLRDSETKSTAVGSGGHWSVILSIPQHRGSTVPLPHWTLTSMKFFTHCLWSPNVFWCLITAQLQRASTCFTFAVAPTASWVTRNVVFCWDLNCSSKSTSNIIRHFVFSLKVFSVVKQWFMCCK